ncbi:hypothetical protein ICM05_09415 [Leucobacter sp. cx-42]|uniref:zinc ribbon domain-containing protein n=1 Tax=unclassified Leucobacter TaxID=2621730 RepID=UPI00165E0D34|nr:MULTISPECIES: C4-type zinc ribbon domain-containing protein [unclassified Leucobacter]MBC9954858.1 hypothetical protein [Leucobacter sp. cx-42]
MKALPRQQHLLLDLQTLDHNLARLHRMPGQLPERAELAAIEGERVAARDAYLAAQRESDTVALELTRFASDVKLAAERRAHDEKLLAEATDPKHAVAIQSEIDALIRRQAALEEQEFAATEAAEAAADALAAAEAAYNGIDERRAAVQARLAAAEQQIAADLAEAQEARAGLAAEVQGDLLALYEETRAQVGIGAARLRGNVSEGSNMALSPAEMSNVHAAQVDDVIFCPGSGAILVRVTDED